MVDPLARIKAENLPDELSATDIAEHWGQPIDEIYNLLTQAVKRGEIIPTRHEENPNTDRDILFISPYLGQPIFHKREFARWTLSKELENDLPDILTVWIAPAINELTVQAKNTAKRPYPAPLDKEWLTPKELYSWLRDRDKAMGVSARYGEARRLSGWLEEGFLPLFPVKVVITITITTVTHVARSTKSSYLRYSSQAPMRHLRQRLEKNGHREIYNQEKHGPWTGEPTSHTIGNETKEIKQVIEELIHHKTLARFFLDHTSWLIPAGQEGVYREAAGLVEESSAEQTRGLKEAIGSSEKEYKKPQKMEPFKITEPSKLDDWFHYIRDAATQYHSKHKRIPSEAQLWSVLFRGIRGWEINQNKDNSLSLSGKKLDRESFRNRYRRYFPDDPL